MNKDVYFMGALDKKNASFIVSKSYAAIARHTGISAYRVKSHQGKGTVFETDSFIILYDGLWVRAHEG